MQKIIRKGLLLAGALAVTLQLAAQQSTTNKKRIESSDVAIVFSVERGQVAQANGSSFWLKGGSAEGSLTVWKGLGVSANLTGEHASNIQNNVNLGKISYMAGPRLTLNASQHTNNLKQHPIYIFGETLFGGVHGFDSVFPGASGITTSANAFSMQLGGGIDFTVKRGFAVRLPEVDYVRTTLPNNASNSQNDFRIAFGVSYRR